VQRPGPADRSIEDREQYDHPLTVVERAGAFFRRALRLPGARKEERNHDAAREIGFRAREAGGGMTNEEVLQRNLVNPNQPGIPLVKGPVGMDRYGQPITEAPPKPTETKLEYSPLKFRN
jgi:hypothetical protein